MLSDLNKPRSVLRDSATLLRYGQHPNYGRRSLVWASITPLPAAPSCLYAARTDGRVFVSDGASGNRSWVMLPLRRNNNCPTVSRLVGRACIRKCGPQAAGVASSPRRLIGAGCVTSETAAVRLAFCAGEGPSLGRGEQGCPVECGRQLQDIPHNTTYSHRRKRLDLQRLLATIHPTGHAVENSQRRAIAIPGRLAERDASRITPPSSHETRPCGALLCLSPASDHRDTPPRRWPLPHIDTRTRTRTRQHTVRDPPCEDDTTHEHLRAHHIPQAAGIDICNSRQPRGTAAPAVTAGRRTRDSTATLCHRRDTCSIVRTKTGRK